MYSNDVTVVKIPEFVEHRLTFVQLKQYKEWLNERNIKYSIVYNPVWSIIPRGISLRNEDALLFKLTFGL